MSLFPILYTSLNQLHIYRLMRWSLVPHSLDIKATLTRLHTSFESFGGC
jgi:hypothetical protein